MDQIVTDICLNILWISQDLHFSRRVFICLVLCGVLYQLVYVCFVENVSGFFCSYFLHSASAWILSSSALWAFRFKSHQLQFCSSLPLTLLVRYSYQPPVLFISPSSHFSLLSLCLLQFSVVYVCFLRAVERVCIDILCVKMSEYDAMPFVTVFAPNLQSSCCMFTHFVLLGLSCENICISNFSPFSNNLFLSYIPLSLSFDPESAWHCTGTIWFQLQGYSGTLSAGGRPGEDLYQVYQWMVEGWSQWPGKGKYSYTPLFT